MVGCAHHALPTPTHNFFLCLDTQSPVAYFEQLTGGSEVFHKVHDGVCF